MTTLSRRNPLRDMVTMSRAFDNMLNEAFARGTESQGTGAWLLPMDAYITEEAIVIRADIPGITPDELNITLEGDTLAIRGEIQRDAVEDRKYVLMERPVGKFERTLNINTPINHDKVQANFKDGVLTLVLPKAESIKPRQITVSAN